MTESRTNRKRISWIILAVVLLLAATALGLLAGRSHEAVISSAEYLFDGQDAYTYEVLFTGEWEYFPDTLLYSQHPEEMAGEPVMVRVPDRWVGRTDDLVPASGNATYRIRIHNFQEFAG